MSRWTKENYIYKFIDLCDLKSIRYDFLNFSIVSYCFNLNDVIKDKPRKNFDQGVIKSETPYGNIAME